MTGRRTIGASDKPAALAAASTRNNGRYNGIGRHWGTPPEVFDPLHAEFNFTLDPCATPETAKCARFFTEAENGLAQSWAGERVFMNPPYGREIYPWTRKARNEAASGAIVVGLVPASTDLAWWHEDVVGHAEVRYLRGRVRYLTGGRYRASGFFASVIVIWRPKTIRLETDMSDATSGRNLTANDLRRLKDRFDTIFNSVLCDMKPGWDDSIEGFNKAWDLARDIFKEEIEKAAA